MLETGLIHSVNAMAMGLLNVPSGTILWDFFAVELPSYTGDLVSQFRLVIVVVGLVVGFLVGLTGVGGGTLLTPLLILLGVRPTIAVGTDLLYGSLTKLAGTYQHWQRGSVNWHWVRYLAMGSVPASLAAVFLLHMVRTRFGSADQLVQFSLGVSLLVATVLILGNEIYWKLCGKSERWVPLDPEAHGRTVVLLGILVGFMVGLTSLGSGSVVAVVLMGLSHLPASRIVGTNIAHALVLLSAAALAHWQIGTVDVPLAANLLLGSLPGVMLGSRLAYYTPARPLKLGMALLVLAGGLKMIRIF